MPRKLCNSVILLILLIPSIQFAWRARDMPQFSDLHDDGLYYVTAKSLASGAGYRIASLPENPPQTKYPPLFPAYLSLVWRLNPSFPENLKLATLACWITFALGLILSWRLFQSSGLSEAHAWCVTVLLAISPYFVLFGSLMFSEMLFTVFLVAALLLSRRVETRSILLAGAAGACAYLTRTAGIALLIAIPGYLIWKHERRKAALFAAVMVPVVAAWSLWTKFHMLTTTDISLIYYVNYIGFEWPNVGLDNVHVVLWKNLDQILYSLGAYAMPEVIENLLVKIVTQVFGAAMIAGVIRLVRRGVMVDYAIFAGISVAMLAVWHYPANERLVLPLAPLALAGLVTEAAHLWNMMRAVFRHKDASQRIAGVVFGGGAMAVAVIALALQIFVTFFYLAHTADLKRARLADRQAAYRWMAEKLPANAAVFSYNDPLLFLYTGHRGTSMPLLPRWWYAADHQKMIGQYKDVPGFCERRGMDYLYLTEDDLGREMGTEDQRATQELVRNDPRLDPVFQAGTGTIFKVNRARLTSSAR